MAKWLKYTFLSLILVAPLAYGATTSTRFPSQSIPEVGDAGTTWGTNMRGWMLSTDAFGSPIDCANNDVPIWSTDASAWECSSYSGGGGGTGDMTKSTYDTNSDDAIDVGAGGTGAKTASGARTNLGLVISSDVQAYSAVLDALVSDGTDFGTLTDTYVCTYDLASTEIDCNTDPGTFLGATALDNITDPDANTTIDLTSFSLTLSAGDESIVIDSTGITAPAFYSNATTHVLTAANSGAPTATFIAANYSGMMPIYANTSTGKYYFYGTNDSTKHEIPDLGNYPNLDTDSTDDGGTQNVFLTVTTESGQAVAVSSTDDVTINGGTGVSTAESLNTITITAIPGEIDHDSLLNFVANEHIDWTADQGATNIAQANVPVADAADALSANGANCTAGNAPLGVDASGAVESCFDVVTQTEGDAAYSGTGYTAHAADTDIHKNTAGWESVLDLDNLQGTLGSDQAEAAFMLSSEMTAYSGTGYTAHAADTDIHKNTAGWESVLDLDNLQGTLGSDQAESTFLLDSDIGSSVQAYSSTLDTLSGTAAAIKAALDTGLPMESRTIAGTAITPTEYGWFKAPVDLTITDIDCVTDTGTVVIEMMEGSATSPFSGTTVDAPITCDNNGAADDGSLSNGTINAGDWIASRIGTEASTPGQVVITIKYTID